MTQNILQATKLELNELNRILRLIQTRMNDLLNLPAEFNSTVQVDEELILKERAQQDDVTLSEPGKMWFQPRELQAAEPQFQVTEDTITTDGTFRRRLNVVQRAAEDGVDVGKASTFNFTTGVDVSLDLDNDRIDVAVDAAEIPAQFIRSGLEVALPALTEGEVYWATDTDTLYIGT